MGRPRSQQCDIYIISALPCGPTPKNAFKNIFIFKNISTNQMSQQCDIYIRSALPWGPTLKNYFRNISLFYLGGIIGPDRTFLLVNFSLKANFKENPAFKIIHKHTQRIWRYCMKKCKSEHNGHIRLLITYNQS